MSSFCSMVTFCASTTSAITPDSPCIEFGIYDTTRLCAKLGTDNYTRLLVDTTDGFAQVKVSCEDDKLVLEPGHDVTVPLGSLFYFEWSDENLADWMDCRQEAAEEETTEEQEFLESLKSESLEFSRDENGKLCIEIKDATSESTLKWEYCNKEFYVEAGKIKVRASENPTPDGVYDNATVTVVDGKPSYKKGCPLLEKGYCDACGTDSYNCDTTCIDQSGV